MSGAANTVQTVLMAMASAFEPIERDFAPGSAVQTFASLGVVLTQAQATSLATPLAAAAGDVHDMLQLAGELATAIDADDDSTIIAKSLGLIQKLVGVITSINDVVTAVHGLGLPIPQSTIDAIPDRAVNLLLVDALSLANGVNQLLELLGVLEQTVMNPGSADPNNPTYTVNSFHFERLGSWFQSPGDIMKQLYQWNDPSFDGVTLLQRLANLLAAAGAPAYFDASATPPALDLAIVQVTPKLDVNPKGLAIGLRSDINSGPITFAQDDWQIQLQLDFKLPFQSVLVVQPTGVTFTPPSTSDTYSGNVTFKYVADRSTASEPYIILGDPGGNQLSIAKLEIDVGAGFTWNGSQASGSFSIGGAVSGGKLHVSFSDADGFIGSLLSGVQLDSAFDFGMGYSTVQGLYFTGASSLEIQLPLHLDLGPVTISALTFSVGINGQTFPTFVAADIQASLGPLQVVVEQIGVAVGFTLENDRSGNAGPVDISVGFKPPKGAGLSIDTGLVTGGGYLYFDPDQGQYAGVAQLSIADLVTVSAVGLITTKMPDGSSGFSLLLIISATDLNIQLGFGFTLNGVGGLLGLNRSVLLDVLRDGVRTGAIDSIMFPQNIIANAPRIISDLKSVFPPQQGTFLIGPMAQFGWGTPALITLSLGIILEIPPGNIAILGVLAVELPDADTALIQIQVNFVGTLDFDEQLLSFDASLYDSYVLFMTLQGDMCVRLKWGDNAGFLLSVGGFHPSYTPPPGLDVPTMQRLKVSILDTDFAKISVDSYFAVTSNTVQFGAHATLFFGVDGCNINGQVGFDVLFQFSPFYFDALITGSLSLQVAGFDLLSINLRFELSGPSPWRAQGSGSISILFFSVSVSFDITWGQQTNTTLPPVAVMPIFLGEMSKQTNWKALPPPSSNLLVSLRPLDPSLLVLHPLGALTLSQRALPLALTLDKVGNQAPDDVDKVDITAAISNGIQLPLSEADEQFALAQFQNMSDAAKLSTPSYQELKGGVTIGTAGGVQSSKMTKRTIDYEITIVDKQPVKPLPRGVRYRGIGSLFQPFLAGSAITKSALSFQAKSQLQPYADKISVGAEGFTVAKTVDNSPFDTASSFSSEAMARQYLQTQLAANPSLTGALQVLPSHEVNA